MNDIIILVGLRGRVIIDGKYKTALFQFYLLARFDDVVCRPRMDVLIYHKVNVLIVHEKKKTYFLSEYLLVSS